MDDLPVMGFVGVAGRAKVFFDLLVDLVARLHGDPPDVLVLVDYPGFNLRAARAARPLGIPTVQVVVPQIWAWAPWRLPVVARSVDLLVAVLPFEPRLFAGTPARALFAGHPLVERLSGTELWSAEDGWVGLYPGSRNHEVATLLPLMLEAAGRLARERPEARFVLPVAGAAVAPTVERLVATAPVDVTVVSGRTHEVAASLRSAMVASGTATLELGLFGVPMAVVYPIGSIQRLLRRALLISPHFALVNVVAGREIVSEKLVRGTSGEARALAERIARLHADGPVRDRCLADLAGVRDRLAGEGAVERMARAVLFAAAGTARGASSRPAP
jgi:lipid-A-disaccharide synthase